MKKIFKTIGLALAALLLFACLGASYIGLKGVPVYGYAPTPTIAQLQVPRGDTALLERGLKIANVLCKDCHRGESGRMMGKPMSDLPAMFGQVYSGNITHDSVHGVGGWTDGQLYYFLRTGIRKDGSWSPPFMPKYNRLAESDLYALIAWLRSSDPSLAADSRSYLPNRWNFTVKALTNTLFGAPALPTAPVPMPDTSNHVAWGQYLANDVFTCYTCHSSDIVKVDMLNPPASAGYYGGGQVLKNADGESVRSANLTPHPTWGIGEWTTEQFVRAVKYGQKPGGGGLSSPMPPYATLSDAEVAAIQAFLKTVPVLANAVER